MNIPDHFSQSLKTFFRVKIINLFMQTGIFLTLDPKFGSGINIPDPQHCWKNGRGTRKTEQES
jgi:hypothetical protein